MPTGFDRNIIAGIVLLAGLMIGNALVGYSNTRHLRDDAGRAAHSRDVLDAIGGIETDTRKLQAAQRAYIISGSPDRLKPYNEAAASVRAEATHLKDLISEEPEQTRRADAVAQQIETGIAGLDEVNVLRRDQGFDAILELAKTRGNRSFVDPLLETLAEMEKVERAKIVVQDDETRQAYANTVFFGSTSTSLGLVALGMFVWLVARSTRTQANDAVRLAEQKELLNATLTSIGDGVIATDAEGRITFLNEVAETLTGWTQSDARGVPLDSVFRIVNESTRAPVENPALRALREGVVVGLANHTILIARAGTERPIDDSAAPIRSRGQISGAVLVFRDISERKAAEAELARVMAESDRRKRLYETILSATPDFVYVFGLDHKVRYANEALIAMWGRGYDGAIGKTFLEIGYEPWHAEMHGREIDQVRATKQVLRGEVPFHGTLGRRDYDYIFVPVFGPDGEVEAVAGTTRDVTERKQAEAERERLVETLGLALAAADLGTWEWDPATDLITLSPRAAQIYGVAPGVPLSREWMRGLLHPDHQERARRLAGRAVASHADYDIEYPLNRPGPVWVSARGRGAYREDGTLVRMLGVVQDVTARRQAEEAIQQANERVTSVLESMNEGFAVLGPDWRFEYVNAAFERMNGIQREEVLGRDHWEVYPDTVGTLLEAEYRRAAAERVTSEFENYYAPWDRWFAIKVYPTSGGGVSVMYRDVTDQRQAAEKLRASEEQYRTLFTSIDQGFCVVDVLFEGERPVDYRFVEANPVFENQTGLTAVVGRTIRELVPDIESRWPEIYGRVANTGEPVRVVDESAALGRWFDVFASRAGGPGSRRVAILFSDITDRRAAEAERERLLREVQIERGRLAEVFQHAPAFMGVLRGPDHVFERANDRYDQLVGGRPLIGLAVRDALPEVVGQGFLGLLDQVYQTGEAFVGSGVRVVLEPGSGRPADERYIDFVYQPLRDVDGAVNGILVQGVDLTARKHAEQERENLVERLREQDKRKDEFLATLAHELRNPLAPVRNGVQILRSAVSPEPRAARTLEMMERQIGHLVHLVDDLMDVSRVSSGKVVLRKERLDLRLVVEGAVEITRQSIESAAHDLSLDLPDEPLVVNGDRTRLSQVLANLLSNAAKYTPHGGRIELSAARQNGDAVIRVSDTGIGIPADMLPKVFDMFTQVGTSLDRAQGGLGIGLTLVRRLVELHGGRIEARSEGVNRGSEFAVFLPLETDAFEPAIVVPVPAEKAARSLQVLVVDDNQDAADSLAMLLSLGGHEVRTANDGPAALSLATGHRPDLILLDIGMPGMNGYEVAGRIRQMPELSGVTVVALTGWGQEDDRRKTREAGFDFHLVKPVDPAALEKLLSAASQAALP